MQDDETVSMFSRVTLLGLEAELRKTRFLFLVSFFKIFRPNPDPNRLHL